MLDRFNTDLLPKDEGWREKNHGCTMEILGRISLNHVGHVNTAVTSHVDMRESM